MIEKKTKNAISQEDQEDITLTTVKKVLRQLFSDWGINEGDKLVFTNSGLVDIVVEIIENPHSCRNRIEINKDENALPKFLDTIADLLNKNITFQVFQNYANLFIEKLINKRERFWID